MRTTIAVIVDDAAYARRALEPMAREATDWVLVVCPPRLTQRIGKWVSHSNREQWRAKWVAKLVAELAPALRATAGSTVETVVATRPLQEVVSKLRVRQGCDLRLLDARRPKLGHSHQPLPDAQTPEGSTDPRWTVPIAVSSSLGIVLALTD